MNAFGTHTDWSTWSGVEIGGRILHLLKSKMDHSQFPDLPCPLLSHANSASEATCLVDKVARFHNYSEPPISLEDYINRLVYYTRISVSPVNLAVALFYLDRLERKGVCGVNKHSVFRLFSIAYLIAFKNMEDAVVMRNSEYCKIAGLSLTELNQLEVDFLTAIEFELGVGSDVAIAQRITRILVPPKVSPAIIHSDKITSPCPDRWTPDSVAHVHTDSNGLTAIERLKFFYEEDQFAYENDDVFDRRSVWDSCTESSPSNSGHNFSEHSGEHSFNNHQHNFEFSELRDNNRQQFCK